MPTAKPVIDPADSELLDVLVSRLLSWQLPETVCSDPCVTRTDYPHLRYGTNLLTAVEARQLLVHVLGLDASGVGNA